MSSLDIEDTFYAYGPEKAAVETVMRFAAVKRWHMIDTTRGQTLAEHSANVGLLAYGIAATCPGGFFGDPNALAALSLLHDLPEVFTGDFPGHSKRFVAGLDELEKAVLPHCFIARFPSNDSKRLVKVCDLADGIRHIRIHGVDITATQAKNQIEAKLHNIWNEVFSKWSPEVYTHVRSWVMFYAYEMS